MTWLLEDDLSPPHEMLDWWDFPLSAIEELEAEYDRQWYRKGYRQGRSLTRTFGLARITKRQAA